MEILMLVCHINFFIISYYPENYNLSLVQQIIMIFMCAYEMFFALWEGIISLKELISKCKKNKINDEQNIHPKIESSAVKDQSLEILNGGKKETFQMFTFYDKHPELEKAERKPYRIPTTSMPDSVTFAFRNEMYSKTRFDDIQENKSNLIQELGKIEKKHTGNSYDYTRNNTCKQISENMNEINNKFKESVVFGNSNQNNYPNILKFIPTYNNYENKKSLTMKDNENELNKQPEYYQPSPAISKQQTLFGDVGRFALRSDSEIRNIKDIQVNVYKDYEKSALERAKKNNVFDIWKL